MKMKIYTTLISILFALLCFTSCQDEITQVEIPNDQETIVPNSNLVNLMSSTSINFGATDDILDGASCFSVALPVTIELSDVTIVIETQGDLEQLENLLSNTTVNDDGLDFVFPITIIFSDYNQVVIQNEDEFHSFVDDCFDDETDGIECADFSYPISFSVFNSGFNLIDTVIIENDETLYHFLNDLETDDNALVVSLNFPVVLEYTNGESVEVNSNTELADAIESAEQFCQDDCDEESIEEELKECQWEITTYSSFPEFQGFLLEFNSDYNFDIVLNENQVLTEGNTWEIVSNDLGSFLVLSTDFEDLSGDWKVTECNDDRFELIKNNQSMVMAQVCETDLGCSLTDISGILQECPWDFSDGSGNFENDQMIFSANGNLQISEGMAASAIGGAWSLSVADEGVILTFSELTAFQDTLEGDWLVVECSNDAFEFVKNNETMILNKNCNTQLACSQEEVRNYLMSCNIIPTVDGYTSPLTTFLFSENLSLSTMYQLDLPYNGVWDISSDDNGVFIVINFNGLDSYNGIWYIQECGEDGLIFSQDDRELFLVCEENVFECFGNYNLAVCDQSDNVTDGLGVFDLSLIFSNCTDDNIYYTFHETLGDAETGTNALISPYINSINPQTIYSNVALVDNPNAFEVYTHSLIVNDCNTGGCAEGGVAEILTECEWNIVSYNGSDNLNDYNFNFEENSGIVVIYTDTIIIDAGWLTSTTEDGVVIEFSNVTGPNIQAINGSWLVVECTADQLVLHNVNDSSNEMVLDRTCE